MSDLIRMTGLNSGLDTESIISAYTSKATKRVTDAKNSLTKNKWTQTAWQDLNKKIYSFYANTLSTNRLSTAYSKQKVTTSNSALSVVAGKSAVNGIQSARIEQQATAAYLTGSKVDIKKGDEKLTEKLGIAEGSTITLRKADNSTVDITIGSGEGQVNTMDKLTAAIKKAGFNANFDAGNQRLFISGKDTGKANDFSFEGDITALAKLGIASADQLSTLPDATGYKAASKIDGQNAMLELNGAMFESNTNTFTINGSTYTINAMPADKNEMISVTTSADYDAVYDVVKDMLKEYNDLINEMSKLYNADSSKGYEPLTDEQKEAMTEKEIEDWENKIKDSLLRNDDTLFGVMDAMTSTMNKGINVGGKNMYLADFGIATLGYFSSEKNERYALHIDGDSDDSATAGNKDKLKTMIASDPETVTKFFSQLSGELYKNLYAKMGSSSMSSIYKVYNDKQLATEEKDWEKKIAELEQKVSDMEDKYYDRFASMEKAIANLNGKQTAVSGMLGYSN
ncbi:MAG: flagellar filament capping protein FliD [Lachnospiraceae bacterium]|nr:flagellar filament capping protein FliD [Lachnospiraceae bacterium]